MSQSHAFQPDVMPMVWSDDCALGHPRIDEHHEEFVSVIKQLRDCTDATAVSALKAMVTHLEAHFGQEDAWMNASEFPPRECHIDEHAAVLSSVKEVLAAVEQGEADVVVVQGLTDALWDWFHPHVMHLDSALAAWLTSRQHGGKPVVIRRDMNKRASAGAATEAAHGAA